MKSRSRWMLAGLALGAVFLWIALRSIALDQTLSVLAQAKWPPLLLTLLAGLAFTAFKGMRWALLLRDLARVPNAYLHRVVYIGSAANLIIAHSGEVLRATLIARRSGASASAVLATEAVERVFDFVALVMLTLLAMVIDPRVSDKLALLGVVGLVVVLLCLAGAYLMVKSVPWAVRLGHRLLAPLPQRLRHWLTGQLRRGRVGLAPLLDPAIATGATLLSVLQWACIVLAIWSSGAAIGVETSLSGALAVFVLMIFGLTLPSPPGQLGTTQLAYAVGLGLVGIAREPAIAAPAVYSGLVILPGIVLGAMMALLPHDKA